MLALVLMLASGRTHLAAPFGAGYRSLCGRVLRRVRVTEAGAYALDCVKCRTAAVRHGAESIADKAVDRWFQRERRR